MKDLKFFLNENTDEVPGGLSDDLSLEDIAKKHKVDIDYLKQQHQKGIKVELEHTNDKKLAAEIAKDHLTEFPDYYTRLDKMEKDEEDEKDGKTVSITVDLDIPNMDDLDEDSIVTENKIRFTKKMTDSSKVVRETTEELFGKEGSARPLADKIFQLFKRELRKKSKDLGVSFGNVRQWKITLRDYDNPRIGTNINGQKTDK